MRLVCQFIDAAECEAARRALEAGGIRCTVGTSMHAPDGVETTDLGVEDEDFDAASALFSKHVREP